MSPARERILAALLRTSQSDVRSACQEMLVTVGQGGGLGDTELWKSFLTSLCIVHHVSDVA